MAHFKLTSITCIAAVLTAGLGVAACASAPEKINNPEYDAMVARMRYDHIDSGLADRAAKIFDSKHWRDTTALDVDPGHLRPEFITAVYVPTDARYPKETLKQRGWIREAVSLDRQARLVELYAADWTPLAFLDADGHFTFAGESKPRTEAKISVADAARRVFGARTYFAIDNLRYEETTIQRKLADWMGASPQDRGVKLEYQAPTRKLEALDLDGIPRFLAALDDKAFYEKENAKAETIRNARTGAASPNAVEWEPNLGKTIEEHNKRDADGPPKPLEK